MCALGQKWVLRNDRLVLSTRRSAWPRAGGAPLHCGSERGHV